MFLWWSWNSHYNWLHEQWTVNITVHIRLINGIECLPHNQNCSRSIWTIAVGDALVSYLVNGFFGGSCDEAWSRSNEWCFTVQRNWHWNGLHQILFDVLWKHKTLFTYEIYNNEIRNSHEYIISIHFMKIITNDFNNSWKLLLLKIMMN